MTAPRQNPHRILIVDDEAMNRELLQDLMSSLGYECETASDGFEALVKLELDVDLVLLDVMMPGLDGYDVARRIRENPATRDLPIVMVTALSNKEDRIRAIEAGANDFINKPIDKAELTVRVGSLLKMKEALDELKRYRSELEDTVKKRTQALRKALEDMARAQRNAYKAHLETIARLAIAAEYRDEQTAAHIYRVSEYSALLAKALHLPPRDVEIIRRAAPMHDVGKIGIPDSVLLKKGRLTPEEMKIMQQHTVIGARILSGSCSPLLQAGEIIALSHHEKWDGSGYPRGLKGESIPLWGRICAVADVFDALTTERPYKEALSSEEAVQILVKGKGTHFDPKLVDAFLSKMDAVLEIQRKYSDTENREPEQTVTTVCASRDNVDSTLQAWLNTYLTVQRR